MPQKQKYIFAILVYSFRNYKSVRFRHWKMKHLANWVEKVVKQMQLALILVLQTHVLVSSWMEKLRLFQMPKVRWILYHSWYRSINYIFTFGSAPAFSSTHPIILVRYSSPKETNPSLWLLLKCNKKGPLTIHWVEFREKFLN